MRISADSRRGNTIIEFTLVGIPIIFVLISVVEIARGMWMYDTLAHAVRDGTRYAIVHGAACVPNPADPTSNNCQVTVADVARRIQNAAVGLDENQLTLAFELGDGPNAPSSSLPPCLLKDCLLITSFWPVQPYNQSQFSYVQIRGAIPFQSAISMLWPGVAHGIVFPTYNLPAISRDEIQF